VKVAVACRTPVVPLAMARKSGETVRETTSAAVTLSAAVPETPSSLAVMVAAPGASALAWPWVPATLEIVATISSDELQVTAAVRSCVEPSL